MKLSQKLPIVILLACLAYSRSHAQAASQNEPVELQLQVSTPFHFAAYGDARFHDPRDTEAANPRVRQALVQAIAQTHPAFISFGGDLVYKGSDKDDWKVWDNETAVWRANKTPVYPALGNHEFYGDEKVALANYFERFPDLKNSRYYSVRAANTLMLTLDSSQDQTSGPQGQWLARNLDHLPGDVDFVFIVLHHPPYTSSSDKLFGGGHSARPREQALAKMLEARQPSLGARIVVFFGHVHNYERHEHGGVIYFVTGGAGAHPYVFDRAKDDPFQGKEKVNYHYLMMDVDRGSLKITMHRLDLTSGTAVWTEPDSVAISLPSAKAAAQGR